MFPKGDFVSPLGMLMLHKWLLCKCLREMSVLKGLRILPLGNDGILCGSECGSGMNRPCFGRFLWTGVWFQGVPSMFWAVFVDRSVIFRVCRPCFEGFLWT